MSCTVMAVPMALAWIVGNFVATSALGVGMLAESISQNNSGNNTNMYSGNSACEETKHITEENFIAKEFETPFNDKEILLKTITEHGLKDIEEGIDTITGKVDNYILQFKKKELDKPYFLTIYSDKNANSEGKLKDLSEEYALNVQEESYLKVVENLKKNNLEIEEEEVLEDNSIVLTINLD